MFMHMYDMCQQSDYLDSNPTDPFKISEHKNPKSEQFRNAVKHMFMLQSCDGVGQEFS